jgi:hypothetical protein
MKGWDGTYAFQEQDDAVRGMYLDGSSSSNLVARTKDMGCKVRSSRTTNRNHAFGGTTIMS